MNDLRILIQSKLNEIQSVDSGVPCPDDMIEDRKTYFGYSLSQDYIDGDFDKDYSMQLTLNGHLVRRNNDAEDTVKILDEALVNVLTLLKDLNIKYSFADVSIDRNIRKIQITGYVKYNEINNWLI